MSGHNQVAAPTHTEGCTPTSSTDYLVNIPQRPPAMYAPSSHPSPVPIQSDVMLPLFAHSTGPLPDPERIHDAYNKEERSDYTSPSGSIPNEKTIIEKRSTPSGPRSCAYPTGPPWKREDGWIGWKNDWVCKEALVVPLIVQAFSAGVLDATTYADFMTFASNRKSSHPSVCGWH
jgi:hypothetical protein